MYIGCFYFTLGNIRPIYRSQLRAIQLLAVAYTSDIKTFGYKNLLQPFVDSVKALQVSVHVSIFSLLKGTLCN